MSVTAGLAMGTAFFEAVNTIASRVPSVDQKRRSDLYDLASEMVIKHERAIEYAMGFDQTSFPDVLLGLVSEYNSARERYELFTIAFAADLKGVE